jgi:hypothetical protein
MHMLMTSLERGNVWVKMAEAYTLGVSIAVHFIASIASPVAIMAVPGARILNLSNLSLCLNSVISPSWVSTLSYYIVMLSLRLVRSPVEPFSYFQNLYPSQEV